MKSRDFLNVALDALADTIVTRSDRAHLLLISQKRHKFEEYLLLVVCLQILSSIGQIFAKIFEVDER